MQPVMFDSILQAQLIREGAVVIDLLQAPQLEQLKAIYADLVQSPQPGFSSTLLARDRQLRKLSHQAIVAVLAPALARVLTGYRPVLSTFVSKTANSPDSEVPMHQDWSFVDESQFFSIGVWCPLEAVDLRNGCLQIVKGSHTYAKLPRAACTPFAYPDLVPMLHEHYLSPVPMQAGQALLFDHRLFHCSPANQSNSDRIAATAVLIPQASQLQYYHACDRHHPTELEIFQVADDFYLHHIPGTRPQTEAHNQVLLDQYTSAL